MLPSLTQLEVQDVSMMKRARTEASSSDDGDGTPPETEDMEEAGSADDDPRDHGDGFSVMVAIPTIYQPPEGIPGHDVYRHDGPPVEPPADMYPSRTWPAFPVVEYHQFPKRADTGSLDDVVKELAQKIVGMRIPPSVFLAFDKLNREAVALLPPSLAEREAIRIPWTLENLIYMRNAYAVSSSTAAFASVEEYDPATVFAIYMCLDAVVFALSNGTWNSTGKYTDMKKVIFNLELALDPRKRIPLGGAQEY